MANTKSSKKDLKRSAHKRAINQSVKAALKTHVKKARQGAGSAEAGNSVLTAISALDKAVQRGIIHKNQAARRKSRLLKTVNAAGPVVKPVAVEETPAAAPKKPRAPRAPKAAKAEK